MQHSIEPHPIPGPSRQRAAEIAFIEALIASTIWPELGSSQQNQWLQHIRILKQQSRSA
jgi:hypothetical protein